MIYIVIPARLNSTRLPEKPLAKIGEYPMIWWTWKIAVQSKLANRVIIATDDDRIREVMEEYGAEVVMTDSNCQSGSDRVYQAAKGFSDANIIVNLQGDEPLMMPEIIDGCIQMLLENPEFQISTAVVPYPEGHDLADPNKVKAVFNDKGRAIYFSRAALANSKLHLGIYAYRKEALEKFCSMPPSRLELAERLEQLRLVEAFLPIGVFEAEGRDKSQHFGVDTLQDLELAKSILEAK
jgi:3-deoxy-manno-octulosonate cytidylyltransferase (CMP-KDO synthetase)